LRHGVGAGREIALRRLVHGERRRLLEVEDEIEALAAVEVSSREVDRCRGAAGGDAFAMRLAASEVDLVGEIDRLLRTRVHARIAARTKIEVDRILLRPRDIERAEPAGNRGDAPRVDRKVALRRKLRAARATGNENSDAEVRGERLRPPQRRLGRTDDQEPA